LYASLGYGAIQVVATIPTLFLIDTKGRRTLTLIVSQLGIYCGILLTIFLTKTFPFMCIFLLAAGLSLLNNTDNHAAMIAPVAL
jgi:hypothetical protein